MRKQTPFRFAKLLFAGLGLILLLSCMWDKDTIEMERQQFPSVLELIAGKFLRHSDDFHYWRIEDRKRKLETYPDSLQFYDDMAVSYSKLGADSVAIDLMAKKEEKVPGLYETYANLGTFHLHAGHLREGQSYIKKAIEINPDAHFGREKYQLYLAEYIMSKQQGGRIKLPLSRQFYSPREHENSEEKNFLQFVLEKEIPNYKALNYREARNARAKTREAAAIGVLGMMKFGNYNSPILLEVLGDILADISMQESSARNLAARAYLKASYEIEDADVKRVFQKKAAGLLELQITGKHLHGTPLGIIEEALKKELDEGDVYFAEISANERKWIAEKENPEVAFASTYYSNPTITSEQQKDPPRAPLDRILIRERNLATTDYRPGLRDSLNIDSQVVLNYFVEEKEPVEDTASSAKGIEQPSKTVSTGKMSKGWYVLLLILPFIVLLWLMRKARKKEE